MNSKTVNLFIGLFLYAITSFGQKGDLPGNTLNLDTVKKENGIYIQMNSRDSIYNILPQYFKSDFNKLHFPYGICHNLKKYDRKGLPCNWFEMAYYKSKFYTVVVSPDDIVMRQINDSIVVYYFNDGPDPFRITSFIQISKNIYEIKYSVCSENILHPNKLNIYITDEKTKQAIFEYCYEDEAPSYSMMLCEEGIRAYPAIVKASNCCRTGPFVGDRKLIPFQEMIAEVKRKDKIFKALCH